MLVKIYISFLFLLLLLDKEIGATYRQKRCIVIQKQSGTRGNEGVDDEEEDFRRHHFKDPMADRLMDNLGQKNDFEFVPELLKYRTEPVMKNFNIFKKKIMKRLLNN